MILFKSFLLLIQKVKKNGNSEGVCLAIRNGKWVRLPYNNIKNQLAKHILPKRVANVLQSALRNKVTSEKSNNGVSQENNLKQSKVGNMLKSGLRRVLKSVKEMKQCQICEGEIAKPKGQGSEVYMCLCEHKQNFCESCLHHYVIYKVKTFEEVHCPHEGCPATLDVTTSFFKQLPMDIQKGYRKLSQFYQAAKNPNIKMCPKENCEGILQTTAKNVMLCNSCRYMCCAKCLLAVHEGECDSFQVIFFQSNLHYRQCKQCKFIIQKNQGCNHMTCRCGNQFCYVCGQKWSPPHYGNHDQNGNLIPVPDVPASMPALSQPIQEGCDCCNCDCDCECECGCMDSCLGQCCILGFKCFFKIILQLLFAVLMLMIFVSRDFFVIVGVSLLCFLAGTFGFSVELITNLDGLKRILAILFFPVTMLVGITIAFREIFCDIVPPVCEDYWDMCCKGVGGICQL